MKAGVQSSVPGRGSKGQEYHQADQQGPGAKDQHGPSRYQDSFPAFEPIIEREHVPQQGGIGDQKFHFDRGRGLEQKREEQAQHQHGNDPLGKIAEQGQHSRCLAYRAEDIGHSGVPAAIGADVPLPKEPGDDNGKIDAPQQIAEQDTGAKEQQGIRGPDHSVDVLSDNSQVIGG